MQSQGIHINIILKILGIILIVEAFLMFACLPISLQFDGKDFKVLLISGVITLIFGFFLWYLNRLANQRQASKKDASIIVVLIWIVLSIFGTLPFYLGSYIDNFTDAFFETISGFSSTGATILSDIEAMPKGVLFWRSLTQWLGGLGFIVFTVALLPVFGFGGMNLFAAEAPWFFKEKFHPRIVTMARRLWLIYIFLTILLFCLLLLGEMNWYEAINHTLTTISTGGFSINTSSIIDYSPYTQYILIVFMLIGSISFPLLYMLIKRQYIKVFKNEELRFYLIIIFAATIFIGIGLLNTYNFNIESSFRNALFTVVSTITTTGYVSNDYMAWSSYLWFVVFIIMFFGGMTGSTSGGVKIMRYLLLFKNAKNEFKRLLHPNAVVPVRFLSKIVPKETITSILSLFMIYMLAFCIGTIILVSFGLNFTDACGSSISAINTIGPGLGSTGSIGNYAHLHIVSKWTLSILMLMGRLEFVAFLVVLSPSFWKK